MVSTHDSAPAPVAKLLNAASATAEWGHPTVSGVAPISSDRRVATSKRAKVASIVPKLAARVVRDPSATRLALADYTLRDSSKVGCCDCHFRNRSRDMTRSRPSPFLPSASVMLVAPAVAACGGGGTPTAAAPKTSMGDLATVGVANSSLGSILVESSGRTVYLFEADSGTKSACATAWPPLLAKDTPTAGTGLTASRLGTITRSGGNRQATYNGYPFYLYVGDKKPGDVNGQGVTALGAAWYVVSPTGQQMTPQLTSSPAGTTGGYEQEASHESGTPSPAP
jgi:predicted lipoprotein with Yx(FWY)xxD motif